MNHQPSIKDVFFRVFSLIKVANSLVEGKKQDIERALELAFAYLGPLAEDAGSVSKKLERATGYIRRKLMPQLVRLVRKPLESYEETLKRIRQQEIKGVTAALRNNPPNFKTKVEINDSSYTVTEQSASVPGKHKCAYDRGKAGLANFVRHEMKIADVDVTIKFYGHASLDAIDIDNLESRLAANLKNAEEFVTRVCESSSVDEPSSVDRSFAQIRVLSPQTFGNKFLGKDTHHPTYQLLQTFLACHSVEGAKPFVLNFGVNSGRRFFVHPLQDHINTFGFNQLMKTVFEKLEMQNELPASPDERRTVIAGKIKQLKDKSEKEIPSAIKEIRALLKAKHADEERLARELKTRWAETFESKKKEELAQAFNLLQKLYFSKKYNRNSNNYWLQTYLMVVFEKLGIPVGIGCNDYLDRGRTLANMRFAFQAFHKEQSKWPNWESRKDKERVQELHAIFQSQSGLDKGAALASVPGTVGHEVHRRDGLKHLTSLRNGSDRLVQLRKGPYREESNSFSKVAASWFFTFAFGPIMSMIIIIKLSDMMSNTKLYRAMVEPWRRGSLRGPFKTPVLNKSPETPKMKSLNEEIQGNDGTSTPVSSTTSLEKPTL